MKNQVMLALLLFFGQLMIQSCANELSHDALRAIEAFGMKDPKVGSYQFFVCASDDSFIASQGFIATNVQGKVVSGMVCCGLIAKGCTVRF